MANPYLILWCDPNQNKIYSGWQKNTQAATPVLKQGDEIGCEIHWVKTGEYTATMQEIAFPPSATIRLAVGLLDAEPKGGTFKLSYGANTTGDLAYNIEATALQTAINALPSITAEGGVTVSKTGNQYRIIWNDAGVYTTNFTSDVDMLYPTSQASVTQVRAGTATVSRVVIFKTRQSVVAGTTSFTTVASPAITVDSIFLNNWRVSISPSPKEGVFSLTVVKGPTSYTTISISADADSFEMAAALNSLNVVEGETFSVIKSGDFTWDITSPSAVDSITATSGLIGFSAMYGVLNMNTGEVEELLAGESSASVYLEVEVDIAGEIQTIAQARATIVNDLIETSSFDVVDMGQVMPVDSVVRYDTSQALTSAEQLTARQNIDAVSLSEVTSSLDLTNLPTLNEKKAMQYSVLPSQTNPFVTMSENNPFDQTLNTTDDVQFNTVTVGTGTVIIDNDGITFPDDTVQTTAATIPDLTIYAQKSNNLSDLASASAARTNLGLGSIATETATNYMAKADNLAGVSNTANARANIGLGYTDSVSFFNSSISSTDGVFIGPRFDSETELKVLSRYYGNTKVRISGGYVVCEDTNGNNWKANHEGITFKDNTVQSTAVPVPSDTSLRYMVTWNGSNGFVCGGTSGHLWRDQADAYQAKYGSYDGAHGSGAISITEDSWTTSTELNARGIKFADGTEQITAYRESQVVDYTAYTWTTFGGVSEGTPDGYIGKRIITSTATANFYGVNIDSNSLSIPYTTRKFVAIFGTVPTGDYANALTSEFGFFDITGVGGATKTLVLGVSTSTGGGGMCDFVYTTALGQSSVSIGIPTYMRVELDGDGNINVYDENNSVIVSANDALTTWGSGLLSRWFGLKYTHGSYYAPNYTWKAGQCTSSVIV